MEVVSHHNTNQNRTADAPAMSEVPTIRVVDVHKRFGSLEVLKGVSFEVHRGNVVSMIGASGSGKSTLLRCINHLETPTTGVNTWNDVLWLTAASA
jgi:ABC-type histidine transport system ATPase subunit